MEGITALLVAALAATVLAEDLKPQSPNTVITIGGSCNIDSECAIQNAFCNQYKKCDCIEGFKPFNDSNAPGLVKSVCAKALGENCLDDSVCFTTAKCIQERCNCDGSQGYVPSKDSSRCLHKSNGFNSSCGTTPECPDWGDGTICSSNRCVCQPDYHFYEGRCFYSIEFGQSCTPDDAKKRCYMPADGNNQHVTCNENKKMCECMKGYVPSDDQKKCKTKPFDGSCDTDKECTNAYGKESECSHNKCKCKDEHHMYNNTCCFNLVLGNECNVNGLNDHCYLPLDGNAQHVECGPSGKCQCSSGYKPANKNQQCVSGSTTVASVSAFLLPSVILLKLASF